jgi:hypothetical protein
MTEPPLTLAEALEAIAIMRGMLERLLAENARLRTLVSAGYAHKRPENAPAPTPIRRQEDVP